MSLVFDLGCGIWCAIVLGNKSEMKNYCCSENAMLITYTSFGITQVISIQCEYNYTGVISDTTLLIMKDLNL